MQFDFNVFFKQVVIAFILSVLAMVFLRVNFWIMFVVVNLVFVSRQFFPRSQKSNKKNKNTSFDRDSDEIIDINPPNSKG